VSRRLVYVHKYAWSVSTKFTHGDSV